jgi:hypothetical protein
MKRGIAVCLHSDLYLGLSNHAGLLSGNDVLINVHFLHSVNTQPLADRSRSFVQPGLGEVLHHFDVFKVSTAACAMLPEPGGHLGQTFVKGMQPAPAKHTLHFVM